MLKCQVTLDKPIYTGFCVLEAPKRLMYDVHYRYIKTRYDTKATLCFTDTDSRCDLIKTKDLYADVKDNLDLFDTSNYLTTIVVCSLKTMRRLSVNLGTNVQVWQPGRSLVSALRCTVCE